MIHFYLTSIHFKQNIQLTGAGDQRFKLVSYWFLLRSFFAKQLQERLKLQTIVQLSEISDHMLAQTESCQKGAVLFRDTFADTCQQAKDQANFLQASIAQTFQEIFPVPFAAMTLELC